MTVPSLDQAFHDREEVWSDIQGHMQFLYDTVVEMQARVVVELGVRSGNSTAAFLAACENIPGHGHLFSVDIAVPNVPFWWADTGHWSLRLGDDLDPATVEWVPDTCDVLFIDTSHAYDHTLKELELYVPKVVDGGVVLLHDTLLEAPELVGPQPPFPVAKAITEYCEARDLTWSNREGSYGLGIIPIERRVTG